MKNSNCEVKSMLNYVVFEKNQKRYKREISFYVESNVCFKFLGKHYMPKVNVRTT